MGATFDLGDDGGGFGGGLDGGGLGGGLDGGGLLQPQPLPPLPPLLPPLAPLQPPAACSAPPNAADQASKATVCGVVVPRATFLRTFANAGELLRFNCQNPEARKWTIFGRKGDLAGTVAIDLNESSSLWLFAAFFLVASTTCGALLTQNAPGVQQPFIPPF